MSRLRVSILAVALAVSADAAWASFPLQGERFLRLRGGVARATGEQADFYGDADHVAGQLGVMTGPRNYRALDVSSSDYPLADAARRRLEEALGESVSFDGRVLGIGLAFGRYLSTGRLAPYAELRADAYRLKLSTDFAGQEGGDARWEFGPGGAAGLEWFTSRAGIHAGARLQYLVTTDERALFVAYEIGLSLRFGR